MDIMKWRDAYETGVAEMDQQHKKLIELVNTMYRVLRDKKESSIVEDVLKEMKEYAVSHFKDEEALMKEQGFEGLEEHAGLHLQYATRMEKFMEEFEKDPETTAKEIYKFLRQWWIEHIMEEDKAYGNK